MLEKSCAPTPQRTSDFPGTDPFASWIGNSDRLLVRDRDMAGRLYELQIEFGIF